MALAAFTNLLPLTTSLKSTPCASTASIPPPPPLGVAKRALLSATGAVFLSTALPAAAAAPQDDAPSRSLLLQKYFKKSQENKDKNDKERLDSYYKRNYKDYFALFEGALEGKSKDQLSDTDKQILDWLQRNR